MFAQFERDAFHRRRRGDAKRILCAAVSPAARRLIPTKQACRVVKMILAIGFRNSLIAIISALISCVMVSSVYANTLSISAAGQVHGGSILEEGAFTAPPKAFLDFCDRYVGQCARVGSAGLMTLDRERWAQLVGVNRAVNLAIRPSVDAVDIDNWRLGVSKGACSDYAIEKRKQLIDLGWSSAALALTVVYTASGQAHLVLTARTDRGDYVLDSLRGAILPVNALGYEFVMWQSSIHPRLWVNVAGISLAGASPQSLESELLDTNDGTRAARAEPSTRALEVVVATPTASERRPTNNAPSQRAY
jgi:predicted transglutaminase-like cysteine proteinase